MFVMTGVLGGLVYLLLCAGAIGRGLQTLAHPTAVARFFPLTFLAVVLVQADYNGRWFVDTVMKIGCNHPK